MLTVFISTLRRLFVCCFCPGVREIKDFIVFVDMNPLDPISMVTRFAL